MTLFDPRRLTGRLFCLLISVLLACGLSHAQAPATTTVADVIYRADGSPASGSLVLSWPAFTTADGKSVAAGTLTVAIGPAGAVNLALAPNAGASPDGTYYKVVYKLDGGPVSEEYWTVPTASPTTIGAIRSRVVPAGVAVQIVSRQYVDSALATAVHKTGDETVAGVKTFSSSPLVPAPASPTAVASKDYVDTAIANAPGGSGDASLIRGRPVDPTPPTRGQSLVFDGASYKPRSEPIVDVVRDCGAAGDGVTDDGPTIAACIAAHKGKTIFFPKTTAWASPGSVDYYVATPATTHTPAGGVQEKFGIVPDGHGMRLLGDQSGNTQGVTIKFAAGLTGIFLPNSSLTYGAGATTGCQGCSVENFRLLGAEPFTSSALHSIIPSPQGTAENYGAATGTSTADGIRIAAVSVKVKNVRVEQFGRHGIMVDGDSTAPKNAFGDNFTIEHVVSANNRGVACFNRGGSDSNAGSWYDVECRTSQLGGIVNRAFLVSTYIAPSAHSNVGNLTSGRVTRNISSISRTSNVVTLVTDSAHNYTVGMATVVAGVTDSSFNGAFFVASVPNSTTITYAQTAGDASSSGGTATNATSTEARTAAGGDAADSRGIRSPNLTTTTTWVSVYDEADQPCGKYSYMNLLLGGGPCVDWTLGATYHPNWIYGTIAGGTVASHLKFLGRNPSDGSLSDSIVTWGRGLGDDAFGMWSDETLLAAGASVANRTAEWKVCTSAAGEKFIGPRTWQASDYNSCNNYPFLFGYGGHFAEPTHNPSDVSPSFWIRNKFMWGGGGNRENWWQKVNNAAPSTGTWAQGDVAWNYNPASGGCAAWVAVSAGTPGTWICVPLGSWAAPPAIGGSTPNSGRFTTLESTVATGAVPLTVASTTPVANLTLAAESQLPEVSGKVVGIRGRAVAATAPNEGDCYKWVAGSAQWQPSACAGGSGSIQQTQSLRFSPASDTNTGSATYVAIDAANFALTVPNMQAGSTAYVLLLTGISNASGALTAHFDVAMDDDLIGASSAGIAQRSAGGAGLFAAAQGFKAVSISSAGSHTFKPVFRTTAGTLTVKANNTSSAGSTWTLVVMEVR